MEKVLNQLTEEQSQVALEIARKAKQMGVDPKLAVALAFRESGLNPNAKGGKGEVGLMQVMPKTAEGLGFSADDLSDPSKNIEIGLTYLKRGLEKFDGDPVLAAAGYNAGLDHPYFSDPENKPLPASTKSYLKDIGGYGGFTASAPQEQEEGPTVPVETPASEEDFAASKLRMGMDAMGVAGGALASQGMQTGKNILGAYSSRGRDMKMLADALKMGQPPVPAGPMPPAAPAAPTGALPSTPQRPVAGGPAGPVGGPASPLQQMGGSGAYNYGKAFGLTDIEAGRATDMTKNPGGANDLINQRTQALQKIQQMGGGYVENPNYGGIMTPQQSVGGGPRASYVQNPSAPGGMAQLPPAQPVSAAPPPPPRGPGPLSQAAESLGKGAGAVMRSPLVSGGLGGLAVAEGAQETQKRMSEGDTTGAGIAAAGGVGGALMMAPNPKIKAIGSLISAASPLTQYLRDKIRSTPEAPELSPEEMMMASRPAFGMYPQMPRPQFRPRVPEPGTNFPPVQFIQQ
jgi:hypothetical protein